MSDAFLSMLGKRVRDRVTKFEGIVSSISFDLYGCVQTVVTPGLNDKDGKLTDAHWFDFKRLEIISDVPVMPPPVYKFPGSEIGSAEKPAMGH